MLSLGVLLLFLLRDSIFFMSIEHICVGLWSF